MKSYSISISPHIDGPAPPFPSCRLQQHDELAFLARMDDLRPRFDTALLAYLRYARASERDRLKQTGGDPDRLPSTWMQVIWTRLPL